MVKSMIKKIFSEFGYSIKKNAFINSISNSGINTMEEGFKRMRDLGISPKTIIDVGAAQGTWTQKALGIWPLANYELIEPLEEQTKLLNELKSLFPNVNYHQAVAGENPGEILMNVSEDLDGSGIYDDQSMNSRKVPVLKIDDITRNKEGDFLIKLDTHGFEVPILKGSINTLERTSLLVIEVYGFYVSPTGLLFNQLAAYLDSLGFRLIDMVDIMRRPADNAFWQCDAFFIKKDHPIFNKNSYA